VTGAGAQLTEVLDDPRVQVVESAHPLPDQRSLAAGRMLEEFIHRLPRAACVLWLVSGGASSLVEAPVPGITLAELQRVNRWLLGAGLPIAAVNTVRRRMSQFKGGGLAALAAPRPGLALFVSDVAGDDPAVIGSGLLHRSRRASPPRGLPGELREILARCPQHGPSAVPAVPYRIVASNRHARAAARGQARARGRAVRAGRGEFSGEAARLGHGFAGRLARSAPGTVWVWGGESTVALPEGAGRGGRSQQLALAAAIAMRGSSGLALLAAGTDGVDGASDDAGAIVDGGSCLRGADAGLDACEHLRRADSGTFLEQSGDLLYTGPTQTNVGDLVLGSRDAVR
jgi:hydroxypyruvate reductase